MISAIASQITGVSIACPNVCLSAYQRKHQSSASLAFVRWSHRWPVDSPHKGASNAENVSIWWRHHAQTIPVIPGFFFPNMSQFNPITCPVMCEMKLIMDHYTDIIMSPMAPPITSLITVYSTVYSGADQENIKAPRYLPLWGEFTCDRWVPLTKSL